MNDPKHATSFKQSLGLFDATMIVAGSMIGSGIFIVSADITRNVGCAGWLIAVWVITGFMTITAAVSYGELSGMFPRAGGQYVYLKEAYNPLVGFLYGWSFFAVIQTATIAAVGVAFARYTAYLLPQVGEDNILWGIEKGVNSSGTMQYSFSISSLTFLAKSTVKVGVPSLSFTICKSRLPLANCLIILLINFLSPRLFWQILHDWRECLF